MTATAPNSPSHSPARAATSSISPTASRATLYEASSGCSGLPIGRSISPIPAKRRPQRRHDERNDDERLRAKSLSRRVEPQRRDLEGAPDRQRQRAENLQRAHPVPHHQ